MRSPFESICQPHSDVSRCLFRFSSDMCQPELSVRLDPLRSEEHTSELQSRGHLVCRLLLEKKKKKHRKTSRQKRRKRSSKAERQWWRRRSCRKRSKH